MKTIGIVLLVAGMANAGTLFSDLGTGGSVYSTAPGSIVRGNGSWITQARPFTVSGSGDFLLTQLDFGIWNQVGPSTFIASIWTNGSNQPGSELGDWTLNATTYGSCCALATQTGITGVTLTGGDVYWMVLGPVGSSDGSQQYWQPNTVGQNATQLGSLDGGVIWLNDGSGNTPAFDVLGTAVPSAVPEPGPLALLGGGLLAFAAMLRFKLGTGSRKP